MSSPRIHICLAVLVGMVLVARGPRPEPTPAAIEAAVLSDNWKNIETAMTSSKFDRDFRCQASVLHGYVHMANGEPAAAVRPYALARTGLWRNSWASSLAARHPNRPLILLLAADEQFRRHQQRAAVDTLNRALQVSPDFHLARLLLAIQWAITGDLELALRNLEPLIPTSPVAAEVFVTRALVCLARNEISAALSDINRTLTLAPRHAVAYHTRGLIHARRGDWHAALRDFQTALELVPELTEARQNGRLAQMALQRGSVVATQRQLTVYVTDLGVNQWKPGLRMFSDFAQLGAGGIVPGVSPQAQILIPMPERLPASKSEWHQLKTDMARGIFERIQHSSSVQFEVRLVQHINLLPGAGVRESYFNPADQAKVKQFALVFYDALAMAKQGLETRGAIVRMPAIVGSNGAFALTETIPQLRHQPIYSATVVDGRAFLDKTLTTSWLLPGGLSIVNRAGDAPAGLNMIANHETAKIAKQLNPNIGVFWTDNDKSIIPNAFFGTKHIHTMFHPQSTIYAKEFTGRGYTELTQMSGLGLLFKGESTRIDVTRGLQPLSQPGGLLIGPIDLRRGSAGRVVFSTASRTDGELAIVYTILPSGNPAR